MKINALVHDTNNDINNNSIGVHVSVLSSVSIDEEMSKLSQDIVSNFANINICFCSRSSGNKACRLGSSVVTDCVRVF